jgi:hypothetical protein
MKAHAERSPTIKTGTGAIERIRGMQKKAGALNVRTTTVLANLHYVRYYRTAIAEGWRHRCLTLQEGMTALETIF